MLNQEQKKFLNDMYGMKNFPSLYADSDSIETKTDVSISQRYNLFVELILDVKRNGIKEFTEWLNNETDFFSAPSSTKYHGACQGGLLAHSLSVYHNLLKLAQSTHISYDSVVITSLFHDVCKANFYTVSEKNVKNEETGIWEKKPYYTIKEELPYGAHGGKSVYLLMSHGVELTEEEAVAINCHMGGWDYTAYHNPGGAYEKYPLAVYLHIADMLATYIDKS